MKIREIYKVRKGMVQVSKHMNRNHRLKTHFDKWLEEEFHIKDEKELLSYLQSHPEEMLKIVNHYDSIKGDYA